MLRGQLLEHYLPEEKITPAILATLDIKEASWKLIKNYICRYFTKITLFALIERQTTTFFQVAFHQQQIPFQKVVLIHYKMKTNKHAEEIVQAMLLGVVRRRLTSKFSLAPVSPGVLCLNGNNDKWHVTITTANKSRPWRVVHFRLLH